MAVCPKCAEARKIKVSVRPGKEAEPAVWSYHCYKCGYSWRDGGEHAGTGA